MLVTGSAFAQKTEIKAKNGNENGNQNLPQPELTEKSYPLRDNADRTKSVKTLQQLTVDLLALANQYKEVHWNVNGPLYLQLHEFFDAQAELYNDQADIFAERVLHLGYSIDGRFGTIARTTSIPDLPAGFMTDNETIRLMVDHVTVLQKEIYEGIKATENSDPVTSNKLQDLAYMVDKSLWQLRIHIQKPGSNGDSLPWLLK